MDFDGAIKAHSAWKMKLSQYLAKPDGLLKPADIQPDNKCAAEVVRKADSGQSVSEEVALGSKSEFATASSAVVGAIMSMRRKAT